MPKRIRITHPDKMRYYLYLADHGMTYDEAAKHLGKNSKQAVYQWITSKSAPSEQDMEKINNVC